MRCASIAIAAVVAYPTLGLAQAQVTELEPGGEYRCEPATSAHAGTPGSVVLPEALGGGTLVDCKPAPPSIPGVPGALGIYIKTAAASPTSASSHPDPPSLELG